MFSQDMEHVAPLGYQMGPERMARAEKAKSTAKSTKMTARVLQFLQADPTITKSSTQQRALNFMTEMDQDKIEAQHFVPCVVDLLSTVLAESSAVATKPT